LGEQNDLLRSVSFDIREPLYLGGIRALGLLDKLVTGPLWRLIESAPNALSLNTRLHQLQVCLEKWSKDASTVLDDKCVFSKDDASITRDEVYQSLTEPADPLVDTYTQMALEFCCGAMLIILERQGRDQLPGGRYSDLDPIVTEHLKAVPTTNTVSERDFAQLDYLMRVKPSASVATYESVVMWTNNKTANWLQSLPKEECEAVLNDARHNYPAHLQKLKEKQNILYEAKLENLKSKQNKKAVKEEKQVASKTKLTLQLQKNWRPVDKH